MSDRSFDRCRIPPLSALLTEGGCGKLRFRLPALVLANGLEENRAITLTLGLADAGNIDFDVPPAAGAVVTAGFDFDVPVRFASDRIDVSLAGWRSGELPSVPLVEVREA